MMESNQDLHWFARLLRKISDEAYMNFDEARYLEYNVLANEFESRYGLPRYWQDVPRGSRVFSHA